MIITQWKFCTCSCILILIFMMYCAYCAYRTNVQRKTDDPAKKDFHQLAPWFTPVTPVIWLARIFILAPWGILFGLFLISFPFLLILIRPVPPDDPFKRFVLKIGNYILVTNTRLLHLLGLRPRSVQFTPWQ